MSRRLSVLCLLALTIMIGMLPGQVIAASYDVAATVAFPAPTQPAVFTNSPNGTTVDTAQITLTGTCEALTPNGAVSIWRNGVAIGSTPCNGSFSVAVMLTEGTNTLVARSASISAQYGPDSSSISVTLVLPVSTTPAAPAPAQENMTPTDSAINAGVAGGLTALPIQTFGVMDTVNEVALDIVIDGGRSPYTVRINWGDGSEETKVVDTLGTYRFVHVYAKPGTYTVKGVIRDVLGAVTTFSYAIVSERSPVGTTSGSGLESLPQPSNKGQEWVMPTAGVGVGVLIAALGYKLGVVSAAHQHIVQRASNTIKRVKR